MKPFMAMMIIMALSFGTAGAAPASPAWTSSSAVSGLHDQNLNTAPLTANWTFPTVGAHYLASRLTTSSGIRFQFGYNFASTAVPGFENRMIMASIDKQLSENWWVTAGYQGGWKQYPVINAGAAYNVSPNVAVSIGYILETNYDLKNAIFRTQLDVIF